MLLAEAEAPLSTMVLATVIGGGFVAILSSVLTAWLSSMFNLRQFQDEKRWERKVAAYEQLLAAIRHLKDDARLSAANPGSHDQNVGRYQAAVEEIAKAYDVGSLIFSDEAQQVVKRVTTAPGFLHDPESESWADYQVRSCQLWQKALDAILEAARKDLAQ